jgi:translation initiation factor 5B
LLTKKQKEEKHLAEIRKQALLASGVQIEGLQQTSGSGGPAAKKVVYGNRKKKGHVAKDLSPAPESRSRSPEPPTIIEKPIEAIPANGDAKSDWEASSDEDHDDAKAQGEAVKDSWDASSNDEGKKKPGMFEHFDFKSSFSIYYQQNLLNPW